MEAQSQFIEMFGNQNTNDKGWTESLVKDEFKLSMGKTPARNNPECWDNGTHKWVSISDMSSYTRYTGDTSEYITDYAIADSGIKAVPKGTIIMSFKLSIGRTAITSEDLYTNEAIMAFAGFDEKKFNIDFLHFLIANKNWLLGAKQAVKGQTLNKESIGNAKIIIPPIEAQEEFASIYNQADKSKFVGFKSQFIEMFGCESNAFKGDKTYAFDDICYDDTKCAVKVPASEYQKDGKFPIFDQSQDTYIAGYTSNEDSPCEDVPVILFGDHSRVFKYINQPFYIGADGVKLIRAKKPNINTAFMYYSLLYKNIPNTGYNRHFKWVKLQKFVLPPMVLQEEFVSIARQADKSKYYN
jgi:type I restriction enzyme S subunit